MRLVRLQAPLFPFGWGGSYSNFSIGQPTITLPNTTGAGADADAAPVGADERFLLTVPVKSISGPAGRVTLQVYASPKFQLIGQAQPVNRLLCWQQATVPAGGEAKATGGSTELACPQAGAC